MNSKGRAMGAGTHFGSRRAWRLLASLLVLGLVATACSSGSDASGPSANEGSDNVSAVEVKAELAALGDLAIDRRPPVSAAFDAAAGSLDIGGGAMLTVPVDAFAATTTVSVQVVNLDFGAFLDNAPGGAVYVVSTPDDVDIARPVMLEVPKPSDSVTVVQFVDGEWRRIQVADGPVTRVPIDHFSTVATAVVDLLQDRATALSQETPQESDAGFLRACIFSVNGMFGGNSDDDSQAAFAADLAFSVCTRALIDRNTPGGSRVSVACVGDNIDAAGDLRGAIDACLAAQDAGSVDTGSSDDATSDEPDPSVSAALRDGAYVGTTEHNWVHNEFEVVDDQIKVVITNGQVAVFEYFRHWHTTINRSSIAPDWVDGQQCIYLAFLDSTIDIASARVVVADDAEVDPVPTIEIPAVLHRRIEFPDCAREFVPVGYQDDGTDDVTDEPGTFIVRDTPDGLTVQWTTPDYEWLVRTLDG